MMIDQKLIVEIRNQLEHVQNIDSERLLRKEELGKLSFEDSKDMLDIIVERYNKISKNIINELSETRANTLKNELNKIIAIENEILNFQLDSGNPNDTRSQIIGRIKNLVTTLYDQTHNLISYSSAEATNFQELERRNERFYEDISTKSNELLSTMTEKSNEMERLLGEAQKQLHEE